MLAVAALPGPAPDGLPAVSPLAPEAGTPRPRAAHRTHRPPTSPLRSTSTPRVRPAPFRLIGVRCTRASRRSAPHRLWLRFGVADTSCHSGTEGTVDSRPLPVAPLHLGSPWRSAAERFRASSLGFDMARCRHDPSRTGHCAHRLGLARYTHRTQAWASVGRSSHERRQSPTRLRRLGSSLVDDLVAPISGTGSPQQAASGVGSEGMKSTKSFDVR
jgi:hypothetical protein